MFIGMKTTTEVDQRAITNYMIKTTTEADLSAITNYDKCNLHAISLKQFGIAHRNIGRNCDTDYMIVLKHLNTQTSCMGPSS